MFVLLHMGCGGAEAPPKTVKIEGVVTFEGQPLDQGKVTLHPSLTAVEGVPRRVATGEISGGKFTLSTFAPGDGAIPGDYKVTVESIVKEVTMEEFNEGKREESAIPDKYRNSLTSGVTATIPDQAEPYQLKIEMKK